MKMNMALSNAILGVKKTEEGSSELFVVICLIIVGLIAVLIFKDEVLEFISAIFGSLREKVLGWI